MKNTKMLVLSGFLALLVAGPVHAQIDFTRVQYTPPDVGSAVEVTGTGGAGFITLPGQSSEPAAPAANAVRLFANATGLDCKVGSSGFAWCTSIASLTADREWIVPNVADTFVGLVATQTLTNKTLTSPTITSAATGSTVAVGSGSATATFVGRLHSNTTTQPTLTTSEEILAAYTLPANTLSSNGKAVRVTAWGTTAANTNGKVARIRFGGIGGTIVSAKSTSVSAASWRLVAEIVRTGAATQESSALGSAGTAVDVTVASPGQTLSGTVDIVVTGQTATAIGDLTFRGLLVEALN